jgi:membrane protease subunit HflK
VSLVAAWTATPAATPKMARPLLVFSNGWGRNGDEDQRQRGDRSRQAPRGEGPPDLEELWRDLNRRLARLFGRGGDGGGRPSGSSGGGPGAGWGAAIVLGAIVAIWLCTGFYSVHEGQVGVVETFGRYAGTTGPGFQWRAPWPIQTHEIVDVFLLRKVEVGTRTRGQQERLKEALMLTDDGDIVDMQFEVQYRVKDGADGARDFLFGSRFGKDRDPTSIVSESAESAMREAIGRRKMDDILAGARQPIADEVRVRTQEMLDHYDTGILVSAVAIQNALPPEQVQAAFDDAAKSAQDRDRQIAEGEAYANDVLPKARGEASRLVQRAEGYRARVTETAEGDAARFRQVLVEYAKAPAITRERMYIDTMRDIFSNTTKILVDVKGGSNLLELPIEKLIQQAAAESAAARASAPPAANPAPAPAPEAAPGADSRLRDGQRLRDREAR